MAIPAKRYQRNTLSYLDPGEIKALLAAPDRSTWLGRRDHTLLVVMIQTGVRVSELAGLRISDVHLGAGAHIRILGKGRKKRATTLTSETVKVMRPWLTERRGEPADPVFATRQGRPLSRYTIGVAVTKHAATAAASCPSLTTKRVTPHTLRHTNAPELGLELRDDTEAGIGDAFGPPDRLAVVGVGLDLGADHVGGHFQPSRPPSATTPR